MNAEGSLQADAEARQEQSSLKTVKVGQRLHVGVRVSVIRRSCSIAPEEAMREAGVFLAEALEDDSASSFFRKSLGSDYEVEDDTLECAVNDGGSAEEEG